MIVRSWSDISGESISFEAIRGLHPVEDGYRLFPNAYDIGVRFPISIARMLRVYVLTGSCLYRKDETRVSISHGQYVDLRPDDYEFEVGESAPVKIVKAFKLPKDGSSSISLS